MRLTSASFALTAAFLFGSSGLSHASGAVYDHTSPLSGSNCDYSIGCTELNAFWTALPMNLAQQDGTKVYALADGNSDNPSHKKAKVGYPKMLWEDTKHVLTAPARWDKQEWRDMGWAALGVVGIMAVVDRPVQDAMRRIAPDNDPLTPSDNRFLHEMERFGREYSLGLLGGFYVAGALSGNETAVAVAQDGLTSIIIASGIITTAGKIAAGRARPRDDVGVAHFRPFGGDQSFPSGHTSHAFAVASVIANHYDETWITYSSYSVASLVGLARSYHGGHFASDIVAGAMIGTMVGKSVVEYNRSMRSGTMAILPEVSPGIVGMRLVSRF